MKPLFQFKNIRTRFSVWFAVVAIIPLLIASVIIYEQCVSAIKFSAFQKLTAIRDLKVVQLNIWLDERIGDIKTIAGDHEIIDYAMAVIHQDKIQKDQQIEIIAEELLQRYVDYYSAYHDLFIINAKTGQIILSTNSATIGVDKSNNTFFTGPLETNELFIKDITRSESYGNRPEMTLSIPIKCKLHSGKPVGVLVARIDLQNSLYKLLLDRTGLGDTGETLIVNKDLYALNVLRYYDNAPLNLHITAEPAVNAAAGETGIIEVNDYRPEPVLAAYTDIPRTGWGFVAKQDQKEIYASISDMLVNLFTLVLITILFIYILSNFLSKNTTRPIFEMVDVSRKIGAGDYSARNQITTIDETSILARSINELAESVNSRMSITNGLVAISDVLLSHANFSDLSSGLVRLMIELSGSQIGAFYLLNDEKTTFDPVASIGYDAKKLLSFNASSLEGEFGQALSTQKITHITDIPDDTSFLFKAVAGTTLPKEIVDIPIIIKDKVSAILSLASIKKYSDTTLELLKQAQQNLNIGLSNVLAEEEVRRIADDLLDKNQELETLAEELKSQADELQEQNIVLDEQRKQVEQANRLKSEFISNISHELRTPLNSILSLAKVLQLQTTDRLSEEEVGYLEIVGRNGRQLLGLINDILDLSKIESGQMDVQITTFSLSGLIEDTVENIKPIATEKGITLNVDISENVPRLTTDEFLVQRILQNIIGNAVKFTEKGGVSVIIKSAKDKVFIAVKDTGIGIPKRTVPHIFDEFRQVDGSPTRRFEGSGLGLTIAKRSAILLGGDILVESSEDKGSTFTIVFPILPPEKAASGNRAVSLSSIKTKSSKAVTNTLVKEQTGLLIVEDQEPIILQLTTFLKQAGFKVGVARGGQEAIDYCQKTIPDGIILDLQMPDVDGFTVLETIRSRRETAQIPVLILTAKDLTRADRKQLIANNIQQLVQKGDIDQDAFLTKIDSMFSFISETARQLKIKPEADQPVESGQKIFGYHVPTLLIVEDNPDNLIAHKALLKSEYNILEAVDGEEGFAMIQKHRPDLVLMDIMLPKMDGMTVIKKVRAEKNLMRIPIIALTGKAMKGDKEQILSAGFNDYLSKPFRVEELSQRIKALLSIAPGKDVG